MMKTIWTTIMITLAMCFCALPASQDKQELLPGVHELQVIADIEQSYQTALMEAKLLEFKSLDAYDYVTTEHSPEQLAITGGVAVRLLSGRKCIVRIQPYWNVGRFSGAPPG